MRADPLLLLTLLGLVGCGLLAALHPEEPFDPAAGAQQAGRTVAVRLEVRSLDAAADWWRGTAHAVGGDGAPHDAVVEWVWFRPPAVPALPGDHLVGRATVERQSIGVSLVLDGPQAAGVAPGPHPVPIAWKAFVARPELYEGRTVLLRGTVGHEALIAPDGRHTCALVGTPPLLGERFAVRVERDPERPGWLCVGTP